MKPFPIKTQFAFLRACLRNWRRVLTTPAGCRVLWRLPVLFTHEGCREVLLWLVSTDGDWKMVRECIRTQPYAPRLFAWVQSWKGGAS